MKDVLKCTRCGTVYPAELTATWGKNRASDGMTADPRCPALIPNPAAAPAIDPNTKDLVVPEQVCRGQLSMLSVANDVEVEEIETYGQREIRFPSFWRQGGAEVPRTP